MQMLKKLEITKTQTKDDGEEDDSVTKRLHAETQMAVSVFESMKPETIALMLKHRADSGDLKYGGLVLQKMEGRLAGKVLTAIDALDKSLASQLLSHMGSDD